MKDGVVGCGFVGTMAAYAMVMHDVLGLSDVTISLPTLVGGQGVISAVPISLNDEETAAFHASAAIVRDAAESLNL